MEAMVCARSVVVPQRFRIFLVVAMAAVFSGSHLHAIPKSAAGTGPASAQSVQNANQAAADFVLMDAKIYTADSDHRTVEALAIRDGRIIFAGASSDAAKFVGPKTQVERAGGKRVLPGLIDAHIHPMGIVDFGGCDLQSKAKTLAEIATFVRGCIDRARVPPGQWFAVSSWEYGGGNQADPDHPTLRAALDAASTQNPIVMTGWDGHHGAYNSAALALAKNSKGEVVGYSRKTLATDFIQYKTYVGVDVQGEPTGDITDQGKLPIDSSALTNADFEQLAKSPERLSQRLNSAGITAVQDAAVGPSALGPSGLSIYDKLIEKGQLTFRLNMAQYYLPEHFRDSTGRIDYDKLFAEADSVRKKYESNPLVRADAIKVFADGVPEANPNNVPPTLGNSPRPVPYLQPIFEKDAKGNLSVKGYVDVASPVCAYVRAKPEEYASSETIADFIKMYGYHPGQCAISYGIPEHAPAIFNEYVKRAHLADYTVHIHSISDMAVHMAIDAIEAARAADGKDSRPDTLAHVQFVTPEDVARMGRDHLYLAFTYSWIYAEPTGYDMSVVPFFNKVFGNTYEAFHDPKSYHEICNYPTKTAKEAGAILVAGSDAPVLTKDPQPLVNMEFGITRARHGLPPESPHQRLNIQDVIDAYTINGARALGRASEIGSLEVGKSADFIILDQDILTLAREGHPEKIGETKVLETWFMGKKVYTAPQK